MKKFITGISMIFMFVFVVAGSVFAFSDLPEGSDKNIIMELKRNGVVSGMDENNFAPNEQLTYAQGISIIVKGLDLNLAHMTFIKQPLASDYFTNISDEAWYADYFVKAFLNSVDMEKDVDPNQKMTREQFAHALFQAVNAKGDYSFIEIFLTIKDQEQINSNYMDSIQKLLISEIAVLDDKDMFKPSQKMTRIDAAVMIYNAMNFVENKENSDSVPTPPPFDLPVTIDNEVTFDVTKINEEVSKVTLSWGEKPNPGYSIEITSIEFKNDTAVIHYKLSYPEEGMFYATVITEPKAETFISNSFTPTIQQLVD
ncbi:S-layer homology domain-containing protein [Chengkuizengella axinellae]|uniref:S-layer homology domain-containing protein n=1 Tax=Chengkuizengella axinellae TaxID=3064388 RepID=A0ABT9IWL0_9BACL|nr:S-layer homology domain-containing protein [Chengkuizengella sp. 2205SS18-9]MDP5273194.1 S-layer homology domain-containing protein [Chengkuizengella sp. 2205SS18-9]